jgi:protein phosphatase
MVVEAIRQAVAATNDDDLTPVTDRHGLVSLAARRLILALEAANREVREAAADPARRGMGSTVAAVFFDRSYGVVAVGHVGDSRVFRVRHGTIVQLTEDHTVVQQWVREGRIAPEEAATSPHRHMITQAVGTQEDLQPALRLERPEPDDIYLLTSDGVHDAASPDEIATVVREAEGDLELACLKLIALANQRGGRDNSTALLVRCSVPAGAAAEKDEPTVAS